MRIHVENCEGARENQHRAAPSDVRWDELKAVLEHLGYRTIAGSGSRRKFYNKERNALIVCHQPHPTPHVDKGCIAGVAAHLKAYGFDLE